MMSWISAPEPAWMEHIFPELEAGTWLNNSKPISDELGISRRELLGLILVAHALRQQTGKPWQVGYDPAIHSQQNDGHVTDGKQTLVIEHKLIPHEWEKREVLEAILGTYDKHAAQGSSYGKGRILMIQPNMAADHGGLVRVSDLAKRIEAQAEDNPPSFEKVIVAAVVSTRHNTREWVFHLSEHFPGRGLTQVDLSWMTGGGAVPSNKIDWLTSQ